MGNLLAMLLPDWTGVVCKYHYGQVVALRTPFSHSGIARAAARLQRDMTNMMIRYGSMSRMNGDTGAPIVCSCSCNPIAPPNKNAPTMALSGDHMANITRPTATKPRPTVMPSDQVCVNPRES